MTDDERLALLARFDASLKENAELREQITALIAELRRQRPIMPVFDGAATYECSLDAPKWERARGTLEDER